jgi:hypothetical protein
MLIHTSDPQVHDATVDLMRQVYSYAMLEVSLLRENAAFRPLIPWELAIVSSALAGIYPGLLGGSDPPLH